MDGMDGGMDGWMEGYTYEYTCKDLDFVQSRGKGPAPSPLHAGLPRVGAVGCSRCFASSRHQGAPLQVGSPPNHMVDSYH